MNRIYLPYALEIFAKAISWIVVITIDLIELILTPFMRIGVKFTAAFALAAAGYSGYGLFAYNLTLNQALLVFGFLFAGFLACIGAIRLVKHILIKVIRPPFVEIVFESVAVSFKRPFYCKKIRA